MALLVLDIKRVIDESSFQTSEARTFHTGLLAELDSLLEGREFWYVLPQSTKPSTGHS